MAYRKCVIRKGDNNLSGFYPNNIRGVFKFRKNDWMMFGSKKEAKRKLKHIQKEIYNKSNRDRWGEKISKSYLNTYKKLRAVCPVG